MTMPPSFDFEPVAPMLQKTPLVVRWVAMGLLGVLALVVKVVSRRVEK